MKAKLVNTEPPQKRRGTKGRCLRAKGTMGTMSTKTLLRRLLSLSSLHLHLALRVDCVLHPSTRLSSFDSSSAARRSLLPFGALSSLLRRCPVHCSLAEQHASLHHRHFDRQQLLHVSVYLPTSLLPAPFGAPLALLESSHSASPMGRGSHSGWEAIWDWTGQSKKDRG